jgi:phospholipid/cholesterol/gamma-HCH transport system permease protein
VSAISAVGKSGFAFGRGIVNWVRYLGGIHYLLYDTSRWSARALVSRSARISSAALASQMVRVGVRSIPIVLLVQLFIGVILALQMAPTLEMYGSLERTADVVGIAIFRELGPLLSAIVLSGFAGAAIAAEIGAMVEAEEIKALRAHALDPIRFLVVPRIIATVVMLTGLTVLADVTGVLGGYLTSVFVLDIPTGVYIENTRNALTYKDFFTGLTKAAVFGMLIASIACYEELNVRGGAEGVGRGTTATVVKCIISLIATDTLFTAFFYLYGL